MQSRSPPSVENSAATSLSGGQLATSCPAAAAAACPAALPAPMLMPSAADASAAAGAAALPIAAAAAGLGEVAATGLLPAASSRSSWSLTAFVKTGLTPSLPADQNS